MTECVARIQMRILEIFKGATVESVGPRLGNRGYVRDPAVLTGFRVSLTLISSIALKEGNNSVRASQFPRSTVLIPSTEIVVIRRQRSRNDHIVIGIGLHARLRRQG